MGDEGSWKYVRPKTGEDVSQHLLLAATKEVISGLQNVLFHRFGAINVVSPPGNCTRCFCTFESPAAATTAATAITADPSTYGKVVAKYADATRIESTSASMRDYTASLAVPAVQSTEECGVPGLFLFLNFVSEEEEAALLQEIDARSWDCLARRRVQHYGRPFSYLVSCVLNIIV